MKSLVYLLVFAADIDFCTFFIHLLISGGVYDAFCGKKD